MGVQLGGRGATRSRYRLMAEINVTPFVDVMLVLLIVFMVTAPLLTVGVPVDLPRAQAPTIQGNDEPLAISVDGQGRIFLMETQVELGELVARLNAIAQGASDRRIFVRGDRAINYGRVLEVMGTINSAGFTRVALVAQQPQQSQLPSR